jgi:prepilin-type N-terminal cleavage/methylation domain-containing protein
MDFIMKNFGLDAQIESISKIHGKVFNIKTLWGKVKFVPLYHPAVAVYNRNRLGELKEDFTSLRPRDKGFSTLEVIISIAIASVLLAIVTYSYQTAQIKKTQEGIVEAVYASLQEQKAYTQAGKNGQNYGVKFNSSEFIEFTGTSYSPSSNQNKVSALDPRFEITETITNSDNIIYFSKLLGNANQTATITVSHIDTRVPPQHIVIEQSGTISVIE